MRKKHNNNINNLTTTLVCYHNNNNTRNTTSNSFAERFPNTKSSYIQSNSLSRHHSYIVAYRIRLLWLTTTTAAQDDGLVIN